MSEESIFAEALEKTDKEKRRAFLDHACAGDKALRARIERLLDAHEKTFGILEGPDKLSGWTEFAAEAAGGPAPAGVRPGAVLAGRYTLLEEIGAGGMGTVWLAEQTEPVRRTVAVKLVKAGMDSRSVLARFDAERQALAVMDHPNIAKVLDGGTTDAGGPFFVMEYVKGVPITRYCDESRLSIEDRLSLLVPVCQAVQHAHTKGVIHRDLKPNNILVCETDGGPVPKVIDFGLAKATQEPLTQRTLHTAHGALLGTPLYMSPEQAELDNLDVDARADVYALGVILYELLTGTTPLEYRRLHEAAWHEMLRLIREEDPPRPSARLTDSDSLPNLAATRGLEPVRLKRRVRGELDWIAMKCLEKDRSRRYETADGLARDVQRFLADESVEACPPSAAYRLRKFVSRNRWPVLGVSAILALLVAGILGTSWGLARARRAWKAEAERAEGERKAKEEVQRLFGRVEEANEVLASVFQDLDPDAEQKEGRPLRAILGDRLDRAAKSLEGDAIGDPLLVGKQQDRLGRTYRSLGQSAKAKALFEKSAATRRALLGPDAPETLAVTSRLATAFKDLGKSESAIPIYEQVRDAQKRALGPGHRDTLATEAALGDAYWTAGKIEDACKLLEHVRDTLTERYGAEDPQTLDTLYFLSLVYERVDKRNEAVALAEQVRDARVKVLGPDHVLSIDALHNLAARYAGSGKMRKALALFEEARDVVVPRLGEDHPTTLNVLDSLARLYQAFGRHSEAIALAERVREARTRTAGAYHPDTIYTLNNLGLAYKGDGQPDKAAAAFLQTAIGLEKLGFAHAGAEMMIWTFTDFLEGRGEFDRADDWRGKWLAALEKKSGAESPAYAEALTSVGGNLVFAGRHARAEPYLRKGLAILLAKEPDSLNAALARSALGGVLTEQKKFDEAEPLVIEGYEKFKTHESELSTLYARFRLNEVSQRILKLYEAWGRQEKADEWKAKLGEAAGHPHGASTGHGMTRREPSPSPKHQPTP